MEFKINSVEDMKTFITLAIEEEKKDLKEKSGIVNALYNKITKQKEGECNDGKNTLEKIISDLDESRDDLIKFVDEMQIIDLATVVSALGASTSFVVVSSLPEKQSEVTEEEAKEVRKTIAKGCSIMNALRGVLKFADKKGYQFGPGEHEHLRELVNSSATKFALVGLQLSM